jgi:NAD(P)-dependent dehydrogenase (short-subunit alcohol dehydrogenase family)
MAKLFLTGASGGLGRALAKIYREEGWSILGTIRKPTPDLPCETVCCDLSAPSEVQRLIDERLQGTCFDLAILAAGWSEAGYLDKIDAGALRRCFEVNFLAPFSLTQALARGGCSRFVFVLSGTAQFLMPGLAPYALSKRALRDLLELRELERSFPQARFLTVWPGPIATRFNEKTRLHGNYRLPGQRRRRPRPPEEVARRIYQAEHDDAKRLVLSRLPGLLGWIQSALPPLARPWASPREDIGKG